MGVREEDPGTTPKEEIAWIKRVFETELATEAVEIKIMESVSPSVLEEELTRRKYDILHFFGHARFDDTKKEGYLRFNQLDDSDFRFYATNFAQLLYGKEIGLVILNGCESGRTHEDQHPARSSIAAALLDRGIPAVVGTQFSIPDVTAHYLSAMIYNSMRSS